MKLLVFTWLFCYLTFGAQAVNALDCEEFVCNDQNITGCNNKQSCLESKLTETKSQRITLTNTIGIINGKIRIQEVHILQTEAEIKQLEAQITDLTQRIGGLNLSLDRLTTLLVERIQTEYKQTRINANLLLLKAHSASTFFSQLKYLKEARLQTAAAMERAETQRLEFDQQKITKEEKQQQVEKKYKQLELERKQLESTIQSQKQLLAVTENDEKKYQQLLTEANQQLASFKRFITAQGGSSLLDNQTKCDSWGCYYSQRDSKWGLMAIGSSQSSLAEYGCLVTSMAMIATHYGKNLTPDAIAASNNPFVPPTAYMVMASWNVSGVTMTRTVVGRGTTTLDSELEKGKPVIVGIGSGPDHFVVIKEKKDGKYIMNDPYIQNGADINFADNHSLASIRVDRVSVN